MNSPRKKHRVLWSKIISCSLGPNNFLLKWQLTCSRYWHHCLGVSSDAEAPGEGELGHHEEAGVLLAAGRVSVVLLLVTHRAAALALVILSRDTEVITTTLVSQTRVAIVLGSLPVHDHRPQIHLIVHQSLGIVSIRQLNHHHLLIHRVKIIQSSLHHSDGGGFVNCRSFVKNCSSVGSITVYRFNLNKTSELVFVFCI